MKVQHSGPLEDYSRAISSIRMLGLSRRDCHSLMWLLERFSEQGTALGGRRAFLERALQQPSKFAIVSVILLAHFGIRHRLNYTCLSEFLHETFDKPIQYIASVTYLLRILSDNPD